MALTNTLLQLPIDPSAWSYQLKLNTLFTFIFLFIAFLLFLFILLSRLRDGFRFTNERWMTKKSQQFITSYMFNEDLNQEHVTKFREKHLFNQARCQFFLNTLLALRKNILGEFSDRLRLLYLQMGLYAHSKQKLYTDSWNIIADGINELAEMNMQQDAKLVGGFINHPNPDLRAVAQVAFLRLRPDTPFSFLDDLHEPLTEWQQVQLASAAHKAHLPMPAFKRWLSKKETSIVSFCVRMIALHNQHNATQELIELLAHPSECIRYEVIKAIRVLEAYDAADRLLEMYQQETLSLQLQIIKTLAVIGDDALIPFYQEILHAPERQLQLAAAKAIARCGPTGNDILQEIVIDQEHRLQPVVANALDVRL